ncbi:MAG: hypothetical protein RSA01_03470 [Clostridium sp.]|uniref:hypothetical protein n=1 Tax=Clostridium sp. TaxID=1506 RepID=UPI002FCA8084
MNKYFKFGLALVLLSPILGKGFGILYSALLATDNIVSDLRIIYHVYDQLIVAIIGAMFMFKSDYIQEYYNSRKNKKPDS